MTETKPAAPNKIFAIALTTLPDDYGNPQPHVYGAIFDVDANGVAADFTPIDFDGKTVRAPKYNNFGKGNSSLDVHYAGADKMLLFPITTESAALLKETLDEVAIRTTKPWKTSDKAHESDCSNCENDNPFYFAGGSLKPYGKLERHARMPVTIEGKPIATTHQERLEFERPAHSMPRAGTNCRQFVQFMLEKIAGVPLGDICLEGKKMPRDNDKATISSFISYLVGEQGTPWNKRKGGRLINMGEGRYAYACERGTGWITAELNASPKQRTADGREMSLIKMLSEESKPFYDPRLNEHHFAPTLPSAALSR